MSITSQSLWWEPNTLVRQYAPTLILIGSLVFSGDQDWPLGIVIACVRLCVCVHLCSSPVQARVTKSGSEV